MLLPEVWAWKTEGDDHHRALLNTCLACLAAYLTAFPASSLTHPRRKVAVVSDGRKERKGRLQSSGLDSKKGMQGMYAGLMLTKKAINTQSIAFK